MTNSIRIYNNDCLSVIPKIKEKDMIVITSPPYNMNLRIRKGKYCSRQLVKEISTKYEGFDDNLSVEEYYKFNCDVINDLLKKSKLIFYNVQFLTGNKRALFKLIGEFCDEIKEIIIWDKITAQPAMHHGVMNSQYEVILVLSNRDDAISRCFNDANFNRGVLPNLWSIKKTRSVDKKHKAVFPEDLVHKIISNFTHKGDIILDPFMGTGTTGLVALNEGRKFIGIELLEGYYNMAKERLSS